MKSEGKLIIFSAPSGTGKTTIVKRLLAKYSNLKFSVSATSRDPRGEEQDGKDYYFLSQSEFAKKIKEGAFVEWEEVYAGTCYGTLRSELQRIWAEGCTIVFDVDVKGGLRLKEIFGQNALAIFIMPPSVCELKNRLIGRATDSLETIEKRISKAEAEIALSDGFDNVVVNDDLEVAVFEVEQLVQNFI